jgi:proteasome lid subunit RPN8/RPN11
VPVDIHDAMISHCRSSPKRACCGILGGISPRVTAIYPLRNIARNRKRYEADGHDLFRAVADLRARGLAIVAIYHCRPGFRAVPSPTDLRENNYGDTPRVIISLGRVPSVRTWVLTAESYEELAWCLVPTGKTTSSSDAKVQVGPSGVERIGPASAALSRLITALSRPLAWLRALTMAPTVRLGPPASAGPEAMWDPLLDGPDDRRVPRS